MAASIQHPSYTPPTFDKATSEAARQGAASYLASRLAAGSSSSSSSNGPSSFTVPTIDLSPSFTGDLAARQRVAAQIRAACTTSGFFTITGHGIPERACATVLEQARRFFHELSPAQKDAIHMRQSTLHRGYEPPAYTTFVEGNGAESKEGFNWGYEPALDVDGCGDGRYVELDGTPLAPGESANLWPKEEDLPGFFEGVRGYYGECLGLARHLFRLFALSLGLEEGHFDEMVTHPGGIARLMYYPAKEKEVEAKEGEDDKIGLGAHSDYECFTLLLPSSTPGLEILSPEGKWVPVGKVEGGLIVNVGDFLMRWTNDQYKSTVHRVVNRTKEARYSVPFFFSINYDQVVETLPNCVSEDNPSKYPPIRAGEYILERANNITAGGKGSYGNSDIF
ncbi:Isopenicillin N synthase [Macrophomina phaseolina MS6]|uniref:Isopenicillin N synthase n=1 Tax=Macrophomina phaseolina (strain MS6) TaxID=1126212 RepID=K2SQR5_MACPH|nr:Isopenicillin N synthase [Macrophomina phaseolina MS6]